MFDFSYLLNTSRVNGQTLNTPNNGRPPRSPDSFERAWELGTELVKPYLKKRSQNSNARKAESQQNIKTILKSWEKKSVTTTGLLHHRG